MYHEILDESNDILVMLDDSCSESDLVREALAVADYLGHRVCYRFAGQRSVRYMDPSYDDRKGAVSAAVPPISCLVN